MGMWKRGSVYTVWNRTINSQECHQPTEKQYQHLISNGKWQIQLHSIVQCTVYVSSVGLTQISDIRRIIDMNIS